MTPTVIALAYIAAIVAICRDRWDRRQRAVRDRADGDEHVGVLREAKRRMRIEGPAIRAEWRNNLLDAIKETT